MFKRTPKFLITLFHKDNLQCDIKMIFTIKYIGDI